MRDTMTPPHAPLELPVTFSIIIPARLDQQRVTKKIMVIDDGSTDETVAEIDAVSQRHPKTSMWLVRKNELLPDLKVGALEPMARYARQSH